MQRQEIRKMLIHGTLTMVAVVELLVLMAMVKGGAL